MAKEPRQETEEGLLAWLGPRLLPYLALADHDHPAIRLRLVFAALGSAVVDGDVEAIAMACELIHRDPMLPFGKIIKSNLARALRKRHDRLSAADRRKVIGATLRLLAAEHAPRELEDYCKLVRKLPGSEYLEAAALIVPRNARSTHLLAVLREPLA